MSEMVERAAASIRLTFRRECKIARLSPQVSRALARAAIAATREPTAAMVQLACKGHVAGMPMKADAPEGSYAREECPHIAARRRSWRAMVDEALR